jgi:hypothetical protein
MTASWKHPDLSEAYWYIPSRAESADPDAQSLRTNSGNLAIFAAILRAWDQRRINRDHREAEGDGLGPT